ncbi:hypothetical protein T439DRAFT_178161 [Meredithblackwellia eburnea MCA 4105]
MSPYCILAPPPPRANPLKPTVLISGLPASGKRLLGESLVYAGKTDSGSRPLVVVTRESITDPNSSAVQASEADFLVLVVDATRRESLEMLTEELRVLPRGWWKFLAVVVTKCDLRSRHAFDLTTLHDLIETNCSTTLIFHSSETGPIGESEEI